MSISAAPAYETTHVANDFAALASVPSISTSPLKSFESKSPAQIQRSNFQAVGVEAQIDRAIGQVFDAHKKGVRRLGLAGIERGKFSNAFNPPKETMLLASAAVLPAFAPVASAIAMASVLNYVQADRKSLGKQKSLRAILEDEMRTQSHTSKNFMDVNWSKTGYHPSKPPAGEANVSLDEFAFFSKPPEQDYGVKILLGQRANVDGVKASNENRAIKGVPVSNDTVDAAKNMDLKRLHEPKILELNLPGRHI